MYGKTVKNTLCLLLTLSIALGLALNVSGGSTLADSKAVSGVSGDTSMVTLNQTAFITFIKGLATSQFDTLRQQVQNLNGSVTLSAVEGVNVDLANGKVDMMIKFKYTSSVYNNLTPTAKMSFDLLGSGDNSVFGLRFIRMEYLNFSSPMGGEIPDQSWLYQVRDEFNTTYAGMNYWYRGCAPASFEVLSTSRLTDVLNAQIMQRIIKSTPLLKASQISRMRFSVKWARLITPVVKSSDILNNGTTTINAQIEVYYTNGQYPYLYQTVGSLDATFKLKLRASDNTIWATMSSYSNALTNNTRATQDEIIILCDLFKSSMQNVQLY